MTKATTAQVKSEEVEVEVEVKKKTAEEKEAEFLAERDAEICKKYKNVTPGSIQREAEGHHAGKLTVEITCHNKRRPEEGGEQYVCGNTRRVATSDLFQVNKCEECVADARLARRRRKAKVKRIDAKKAKEAEGGTAVATKPAKTKTKAEKPKAAPKKAGEKAPRKSKAPKPLTPVETETPEEAQVETPEVEATEVTA